MGRTAVLVDGFKGVKTQRGRRYLWLEDVKLASRLRQRDQIVDVCYFTAPVLDDVAAAGRQQTYLEARALPCVQCPLDQLRGGGGRRQHRRRPHVEIAALPTVDTMLLVSADSDWCQAVGIQARTA
ncbi:hypothetical protein [Streptomyces sp. NPDC051286]|uniref:hypothetical protein n=1 Tax=Streptomyces sp. NPDC051286 TaxID=3365647 RepID=UPI0037B71E17